MLFFIIILANDLNYYSIVFPRNFLSNGPRGVIIFKAEVIESLDQNYVVPNNVSGEKNDPRRRLITAQTKRTLNI